MNLRKFLYKVGHGGGGDAHSMAQVLRDNGYWAGEFVSESKLSAADELNDEQTLRWFLGQGIAIVDKKAWFDMNSWVNCIDKFVPEDAILTRVDREYFDEELFSV